MVEGKIVRCRAVKPRRTVPHRKKHTVKNMVYSQFVKLRLCFGECRFACLSVCPIPLYTRPYRTIQKIPYHIPENTVPHTGRVPYKKYRATYQTSTVRKMPYNIPDDTGTLPYNTVPKIPHHLPDHTIPYPHPASPYRTHTLPYHTVPYQ